MSSLPQTLEGLQSGLYKGITKLKISSGISQFPLEILSLSDTLEILDLSGNTGLSQLPTEINQLYKLKVLFLSNCTFTTFPKELAGCPSLEMVAFKSNKMRLVPENSLPKRLRWLILTDNEIAELPASIGQCERLQKCMLAGNRLRTLPSAMQACRKLGLLRLSCNLFEELPDWLFEMQELGFLSFSGNPCSSPRGGGLTTPDEGLDGISWSELSVQELLGEGASGVISKAIWSPPSPGNSSSSSCSTSESESERNRTTEEVALKIFKGALTSDGSPADEMAICIAAGQHTNLISPLGTLTSHPHGAKGLVLELIPKSYANLGLPPNFETCTRDVFPAEGTITPVLAVKILLGIATAAEHLHSRKLKHGDLYAHNILFDERSGHAFLGDFGAGTAYGDEMDGKVERLEVLAFGWLVEDLVGLVRGGWEGEDAGILGRLVALQCMCTGPVVKQRPPFGVVRGVLEGILGKAAA